jgi:hypothetical protein
MDGKRKETEARSVDKLAMVPTDILIKAIAIRSDRFAIAYSLPTNNHERGVLMLHGKDYYGSLGLATGLYNEMKSLSFAEEHNEYEQGADLDDEDDR